MDILVVSPKEHKLPQWWVTFIRGLYLTEYSFKSFSKKEEAYSLERVQLMTNGKVVPPSTQASVKKAAAITQSIAWARDWVNTPSNAKTPTLLANAMAKTVLKTPGLKCKIYTEKNIQSHQMRLLMAVAQGSEEQPRVVHLEYVGKNAKKQAPIVLVGKGVTFDSGGLSLKPPDGMYGMKMDMGGAAAVFAAVWAAAQLNLPIHVHALLGLVENMPSGHAIRPGDIVTARSGKTVEINNTDAEGRLVLADLLDYAQTLKPACVIDVATLTGACMVALGPYCTGLFSNHPKLAQQLQTSADSSGEEMWQLPMPDSLRAQLKSDCADIRNTGDRYGGAITAALFLKEFIHPNVPWGHLDIAGPATRQSEESIYQKGATGVPTATLIHFLENYSAKDL